jgi:hypothetical protein
MARSPEALGDEPGCSDAVRSRTPVYGDGRMIHEDDRSIMFANL